MHPVPHALPILVALALVAAGSSPSEAAPTSPGPGFHGACSLSGEVHFRPAIGFAGRPGQGLARATGRCSGVLDLHGQRWQLNDASATYRAHDASPAMDCEGGRARGAGRLRLAGHPALRFRLTEIRIGPLSILQLSASAWSAAGEAHTALSQSPIDEIEECATGRLAASPITIHLQG